jgi:hypothetical protein
MNSDGSLGSLRAMHVASDDGKHIFERLTETVRTERFEPGVRLIPTDLGMALGRPP